MLKTGSIAIDAERAYAQVARSRRRAALARRLRGEPAECGRLAVYDRALWRGAGTHSSGIREIPLSAIRGTVEPSRAVLFDRCFRPRPAARSRWQQIWRADLRAVLAPISVVPVEGGYAVLDGHHRVSVARARGALAIDATVEADLR